jgi:enoyl-CoA hydratase/carnithine racemase
MVAGLKAAFQMLRATPSVRAAVVTGAGAGDDCRHAAAVSPRAGSGARPGVHHLAHEAIEAVHEAPFPTVAMINGACLGAGFELAMACDLRTAAAGAPLGLPEVRVGIPSVIEAALLPALIGPGRAAEVLLTGDSVTAETALAWGLVNRVAPAAELGASPSIWRGAPSSAGRPRSGCEGAIIRWRVRICLPPSRPASTPFAARMPPMSGRPCRPTEKRPPRFFSSRALSSGAFGLRHPGAW